MTEPDNPSSSMNLAFAEALYADFLQDKNSVPPDWRRYFESFSENNGNGSGRFATQPSFESGTLFNPTSARTRSGTSGRAPKIAAAPEQAKVAALQERVDQLVRNYRVRGHIVARFDPLNLPRHAPLELNPDYYHFSEAEMDRPFSSESLPGPDALTLRKIIDRMRNTYCRSIGVQFMHIDDLYVREWLQQRMEGSENRIKLTRKEQLRILTRLTDAVIFEDFIQKKFVGAKSFSLEGAESLIPLLELSIEKAAEQGVQEIVLGMAHRGRLNVLANIMGKSPRQIFREFEDKDPALHTGHGDVKYHLGHSCNWKAANGKKVHLSLCFNPSHLEYVNPVALGRVRAKQDRVGDLERVRGMALLIHGDAAFAGEGVVQETLNLSELTGYSTGGTVHIVVNNQIGFTTDPSEARSSVYATDVAKMLQTPIFHVNGEDPEAVAQVVRLAMDFRKTFQRDVVIDMYCYRRRGHNESDEPAFTQALMYQAIEKRKSVRDGYLDHLLQLGGVTREEADKIALTRREQLEQDLTVARSRGQTMIGATTGVWRGYTGGLEKDEPDVDTGVKSALLARLLEKQAEIPADFHLHPKLQRLLELRRQIACGEKPVDWAAAEALALASLAVEGSRIRFSGQDSARGTFSHRHAMLHDTVDGHGYMPLQNLSAQQAPVEIYNSPLSESGVLGFEYGYSLDCPDALVLWEAQFGDFWNVAQVIIDQFIASAEDKWKRLSGVVLLLPHGFEGMGPEHSSARLERFLTLCADDNFQVVYPSTPAQFFHLLRRQVKKIWRKPLVVMTPKSLLRLPECVSTMSELAEGSFQRIIPDHVSIPKPRKILLCTGKIYYDLLARRKESNHNDVAIIRIEQLYPLRLEILEAVLKAYPDGTPAAWVQEEPENMGAAWFLRIKLGENIFGKYPLSICSRAASSSPATGSSFVHKREQKELVECAFK